MLYYIGSCNAIIKTNNFDEIMSCKLSKNGDLISKMYIKNIVNNKILNINYFYKCFYTTTIKGRGHRRKARPERR